MELWNTKCYRMLVDVFSVLGSFLDIIDFDRIDFDRIDSNRIDFERIDLCLDTIIQNWLNGLNVV